MESVCRGNPTVGSNPTLSAIISGLFSITSPVRSFRIPWRALRHVVHKRYCAIHLSMREAYKFAMYMTLSFGQAIP